MKIEYIALCLLIALLLYFWYNHRIESFYSENYNLFEYDKPFMIIESNKLLALTLLDDNQTIQFKDYKTYNPRQFWIPVRRGNNNISSQPNNRSCNKLTQAAIAYGIDEMMLVNYHDPTRYLNIVYNRETGGFNYHVVKLETIITKRSADNLDSPIFTSEINDRSLCAVNDYTCFTCTKCIQQETECTQTEKVCAEWGTNCTMYRHTTSECVEREGMIPQYPIRVVFWEHEFSGQFWTRTNAGNEFALGHYIYGSINNDVISSVEVDRGTILEIYEHYNYGGQKWTFVGPAREVFKSAVRNCVRYASGRNPTCLEYRYTGQYQWDERNDKLSSFIIKHDTSTFINSDKCVKYRDITNEHVNRLHSNDICVSREPVCNRYIDRCINTRNYCQRCKTFTGQYNPITCLDETNNLPSIIRYKFNNNRLSIVNNIQVPNNTSFNTSTQYLYVNDDNTPTIRLTPYEFYFIAPNEREKIYQQYLIRNNLLPTNPALKQSIQNDLNIYLGSQTSS